MNAASVSYVKTFAGSSAGTAGTGGDGIAPTSSDLNAPVGLFQDAAGDMYIADVKNNRIQFIPKTSGTYYGQSMTGGEVYTIAGSSAGTQGVGADNKLATSSDLGTPYAVVADSAGNVYIADTYNCRIQFIPAASGTYFGQSMTANYVYTIAGLAAGTYGVGADNKLATTSALDQPVGLTVDTSGNLYISDTANYRVQFVPVTNGTYFGQSMTANYVYMIAGVGGTTGEGPDNVLATTSDLSQPYGIAIDAQKNVYIADIVNSRIQFVPRSSGTYFGQSMTANFVYTIAGTGTAGKGVNGTKATSGGLDYPADISLDSAGNFYIADALNNRVVFVPLSSGTYFSQSMTAGDMYTIAGTGTQGTGSDGIAATSSGLYNPFFALPLNTDNVLVSDTKNNRIQLVYPSLLPTVTISSSANPATSVTFTGTVSGGNGNPTPTGTMTFINTTTSTTLCSDAPMTVTGLPSYEAGATCSATLPTTGGPFAIEADYNGDSNYLSATSSPLSQQVNSCSGGSLSLSAPSSIAFPSTTISGTSTSSSASLVLTPSDLTGSGAGWNISATSTTFTASGGSTLPTTATSLTSSTAAAATGNCNLPTNAITPPIVLPAGASPPSAAILYSAATSSGEGPSNITCTFTISIPAGALPGSYSSTWTFSIASGP